MVYWHEFLLLALIHFLAVVIPGPDFAVVVQQSVSLGRRVGIMTALGIGTGISVHVLYTILGFGLLIQTNELIFNSVKIIASIYLLYLGWGLIKSNMRTNEAPALETHVIAAHRESILEIRSAFIKGFITNATNPKATVFFLGIFTSIVSPLTPIHIQFLYGLWMCLVNALWFIVVASLFTLPAIRQLFLKKKKWFEIVMGIILMILAIRLLLGFHISPV